MLTCQLNDLENIDSHLLLRYQFTFTVLRGDPKDHIQNLICGPAFMILQLEVEISPEGAHRRWHRPS